MEIAKRRFSKIEEGVLGLFSIYFYVLFIRREGNNPLEPDYEIINSFTTLSHDIYSLLEGNSIDICFSFLKFQKTLSSILGSRDFFFRPLEQIFTESLYLDTVEKIRAVLSDGKGKCCFSEGTVPRYLIQTYLCVIAFSPLPDVSCAKRIWEEVRERANSVKGDANSYRTTSAKDRSNGRDFDEWLGCMRRGEYGDGLKILMKKKFHQKNNLDVLLYEETCVAEIENQLLMHAPWEKIMMLIDELRTFGRSESFAAYFASHYLMGKVHVRMGEVETGIRIFEQLVENLMSLLKRKSEDVDEENPHQNLTKQMMFRCSRTLALSCCELAGVLADYPQYLMGKFLKIDGERLMRQVEANVRLPSANNISLLDPSRSQFSQRVESRTRRVQAENEYGDGGEWREETEEEDATVRRIETANGRAESYWDRIWREVGRRERLEREKREKERREERREVIRDTHYYIANDATNSQRKTPGGEKRIIDANNMETVVEFMNQMDENLIGEKKKNQKLTQDVFLAVSHFLSQQRRDTTKETPQSAEPHRPHVRTREGVVSFEPSSCRPVTRLALETAMRLHQEVTVYFSGTNLEEEREKRNFLMGFAHQSLKRTPDLVPSPTAPIFYLLETALRTVCSMNASSLSLPRDTAIKNVHCIKKVIQEKKRKILTNLRFEERGERRASASEFQPMLRVFARDGQVEETSLREFARRRKEEIENLMEGIKFNIFDAHQPLEENLMLFYFLVDCCLIFSDVFFFDENVRIEFLTLIVRCCGIFYQMETATGFMHQIHLETSKLSSHQNLETRAQISLCELDFQLRQIFRLRDETSFHCEPFEFTDKMRTLADWKFVHQIFNSHQFQPSRASQPLEVIVDRILELSQELHQILTVQLAPPSSPLLSSPISPPPLVSSISLFLQEEIQKNLVQLCQIFPSESFPVMAGIEQSYVS